MGDPEPGDSCPRHASYSVKSVEINGAQTSTGQAQGFPLVFVGLMVFGGGHGGS